MLSLRPLAYLLARGRPADKQGQGSLTSKALRPVVPTLREGKPPLAQKQIRSVYHSDPSALPEAQLLPSQLRPHAPFRMPPRETPKTDLR